MNIVRELVSYDKTKNRILYKWDFEKSNELSILLSMSCDINMLIRQLYDWEYEHLKDEYQSIIKKIESSSL
jgi:hypothetical protein